MTINQNMRDLRQISGMTQEEVAARVGLTRQAISSYESGRTQPDIDMLVKLAQLYNADVSDILYGRSHEQKKLRSVRRVAAIVFIATLVLVFASSSLLLIINTFFVVPDRADANVFSSVIEVRFAILDIREALQGLAGAVSVVGCIILGVKLAALSRRPPIKKGLLAALAFTAGNILCTVPFGAFDEVYAYADYTLVMINVLWPVAVLMLYWAALDIAKAVRSKKAGK